jgi:hypothetical protein
MLSPAPAYKLWLTGEGTDPTDMHHPILSHCIGRRGLTPPLWGGGGVRPSGVVICSGVNCRGP